MKQAEQNNTSKPGFLRRWGLPLAILIAVAVVGGGATLFSANRDSGDDAARAVFPVVQEPMTISVTVSGTIKAREQEVIKNEVEGRTTILWLVDEGKHVKKGDLLVELDASSLEDQKVDQQIKVQNGEAAFIQATEKLEVTRSQGESDIAEAQLKYDFARLDLKKYIEGEYPQQKNEAEAKITIAKEELQRVQDKLAWSDKLADEGYITRTELQADELAANKAKLDLELAEQKLDLLEKYTYDRQIRQLESDIEQAERALERTKKKAAADLVQAEADLRAKDSEFERQKDKLNKILQQIAKCRITAPTEGMVVYATTGQGGWRGNEEPLDEGREVREREELIHLPTAASMMAEVKIHESNLDKVKVNQPVRITIDALPNKVFHGHVAKIGLLPDAQSAWMNPDLKVYNTEIHIDSDSSGLRTGMTCTAEVIVDRYDNTLQVPLMSVIRVQGQPTVYVATANGPQPRPVEIGLDNNRRIRIISGVKPGEPVLISPPLTQASVADTGEQTGPVGGEARPATPAASGEAPATQPVAEAAATQPAQETEGATEQAEADEAPAFDPSKFRDMTPEQRREAFEKLTPEQRQKLMERFQRQMRSNRPQMPQ